MSDSDYYSSDGGSSQSARSRSYESSAASSASYEKNSKIKSRSSGGGEVITSLPEPPPQKDPRHKVGYPVRRCTDIFFLLLFLATWVGMWIVAGYALDQGDPQKIYFPMDSLGNLCGKDNVKKAYSWIELSNRRDFSNKTFLYFHDPTNLNVTTCVNACPSQTSLNPACLTVTPTQAATLGLNCICYYDFGPFANKCYPPLASKPVVRRCVPTDLGDVNAGIKKSIDAAVSWWQRFWDAMGGDNGRGWKLIASTIGFSCALALIWMGVMYFFAPLVVWFTITLGWCGMALGAAWLVVKAREWTDDANAQDPKDTTAVKNAEALTVTSWVVVGLVVIFFFIIVFMFKRIQIAIGIIRCASRACGENPSIFLSPFISSIGAGLIGVWGFYIGVYLYSAGEIEVGNNGTRSFNFNQELKGAIVYWAFGWSWTIFFIFGIMNTAVALVVSRNYFRVPNGVFALASATGIVLFYHLGTIAFGTMLIAIVFSIRVAFKFVQQNLKQYIHNNPAAKLAICCIECCLACFQRFLEFITSNAFVQVAIHGTPFCTSAKNASRIIVNNPARVAAVTAVTSLVLFLGKVFVAACTTVIVQSILNYYKVERNYITFFCLFVIAYIIAYLFFAVYQSSIRTILQCFVEDEARNRPNVFAPPYLKKYMVGVSANGQFA